VQSAITSPLPIEFVVGQTATVLIENGFFFSNALGTNTPAGKFVYMWGAADDSMWMWVRAELHQISGDMLTVTPRQASGTPVRFSKAPTASLEEAVSLQLSGTTIRRATAIDLQDPAKPVWSPANEVARNIASLAFTYYDSNNQVVVPTSPESRASIERVDVAVGVQPSEHLSDRTRPIYSISLRTIPRNFRIR
jgi:hypothetical protein